MMRAEIRIHACGGIGAGFQQVRRDVAVAHVRQAKGLYTVVRMLSGERGHVGRQEEGDRDIFRVLRVVLAVGVLPDHVLGNVRGRGVRRGDEAPLTRQCSWWKTSMRAR